jgi:Mg-chelatase subunit ChlI
MPDIVFPFSAIVGQDAMKRALLLNAVAPQIGGVLIRGERGTAKSTVVRGLAALLPEISVVADCRFACDPDSAGEWCDECRVRQTNGETLPVTTRRVRIVELPVGATEDRVVGTLDFERAIQQGIRRFQEGVLGAVNRGILYVDEVNLLDDHVVDLLLDAAAQGVNIVEREGISFRHPARFVLVGTMNPEEGELRPQLLDRFGFCADVRQSDTLSERIAIMERCLAAETDPEAFQRDWREPDRALAGRITAARARLQGITHSQHDLATIARLVEGLAVEGHRAELTILRGARAQAALDGRSAIAFDDIRQVAGLALAHRVAADHVGSSRTDGLLFLEERIGAAAEDPASLESEQVMVEGSGAKKKPRIP